MNKSIVALKNAATIGALAFVLFEPTRAQSVGETEKGQILTIQKQWADARVKPDIAMFKEGKIKSGAATGTTWQTPLQAARHMACDNDAE